MHLTVPIFGEYKSQEWQEPLIKLNPTHVVKTKSLTNATAPQTVLLMSLVTKHTSLVLPSSFTEYFTVSLSAQVALWSIKLFQFAVCRENGKLSLILMQFCWETGGRASHEYFIKPEKNVLFADVRLKWENLQNCFVNWDLHELKKKMDVLIWQPLAVTRIH